MIDTKADIVLASGSPRRKQLMEQLGLTFTIRPASISEEYPDHLSPFDVPGYLAEKKAHAIRKDVGPGKLVIGADTVVLVDGEILGKPTDREEALGMLGQLSDNVHQVITGVCMLWEDQTFRQPAITKVHFDELTPGMMEYYVDEFRPYDKAGGYAIQEWIGLVAIPKIEGDYFNVVGLPVHLIYDGLKRFGWVTD